MPDYSKYNRQYKAIPACMTNSGSPLSVRVIRTMTDNLNNYFLRVGNHKIIGQPCVPEWKSHLGTTENRVILPFTWRSVPKGYLTCLMILHHYRVAGAGSVTWRMYCSGIQYVGHVTMDTTMLSADYAATAITSDSQYLKRSVAEINVRRGVMGDCQNASWFTLTAQASDDSTQAAITSIDLFPWEPDLDG
jgi:hypothetical protein